MKNLFNKLAEAFRRKWDQFRKPKYDYNIVVIGAGSGGLVSAYIGAAVNAKVALIEKNKMGGDCLNTGCVPSKAIIRSAKILDYMKNHEKYGIKKAEFELDFKDVMSRVHNIIEKIEPHDSVERYTELGVDVIQGTAKLLGPHKVEVDGKILTAKNIILATGAEPLMPPIPGLKDASHYTSDTLWDMKELPKKLVVLGGGPIGSETTQAFARLGSQVTQVEMQDQIMGREDPEVAAHVRQKFEDDGITVLTGHKAKEFIKEGGKQYLICEHNGKDVKVEFDAVLVALGRKARTKGFGLEEAGVKLTERGTIEADPFMRTNIPSVYVVGDATGPFQFTHTAGHQAWYAAVNALFGSPVKKFKTDYSVIPWATFTDPEVARVGLNEMEAKDKGIKYEVTRYDIDDLDRAIADSNDHGFIKVLTVPGKDKILGVTIVGAHAGDLIAEYVLAMKHGLGLNKILETIHIYPTMSEANKYAAGNWKKDHKPEKTLKFLKKFHAWRRG